MKHIFFLFYFFVSYSFLSLPFSVFYFLSVFLCISSNFTFSFCLFVCMSSTFYLSEISTLSKRSRNTWKTFNTNTNNRSNNRRQILSNKYWNGRKFYKAKKKEEICQNSRFKCLNKHSFHIFYEAKSDFKNYIKDILKNNFKLKDHLFAEKVKELRKQEEKLMAIQ